MTIFLRLLAEDDKAAGLAESCVRVRQGADEERCFEAGPESFDAVPGKPFAYWVGDGLRDTFVRFPSFLSEAGEALVGLQTSGDFRFLRLRWEQLKGASGWAPFAKGGAYSPYFSDVHLMVRCAGDFAQIVSYTNAKYPYLNGNARSLLHADSSQYFRPGLTWPRRTTSGLSLRVLPAGCVFADKGPASLVAEDDPIVLLALLALTNSHAFGLLVSLQLAAADAAARSYEVGVIQRTPVPVLSTDQRAQLAALARRSWSLKRSLDTVTETSHVFLLPLALRQAQADQLGVFDPLTIEAEIARIQAEVDDIVFELYGFSDADRAAALGGTGSETGDGDEADESDADEDETPNDTPSADALLSWAIGVAFGRFDIRLATGERAAPPEPEPFDPLPAKSPGMLPDGDAPFHAHTGILVDDPGHAHDLVRIAERVLEQVDLPVPAELRRWLQKDFFPFHLQRYSKSRRKAPIYWPLSTASGSYTLWLYYPSLTSQTLYSAINDFIDGPKGKLTLVMAEATDLRVKGSARSRDEEKHLEALTTLEAELRDLRDQLQAIAPHYQPNHDDGVQITAAPLWPLFRHKPWQKVLKDTWAKLEKGDYDWAHLAMNYWPERVREKCKDDKSLAIAHGLEELYVEPPAAPKKARGRKTAGAEE